MGFELDESEARLGVLVASKTRDATDAAQVAKIHRALLTGLLANLGLKTETGDYVGPRGTKFRIFPGSALFRNGPKWLMASEVVRTTAMYARSVAARRPVPAAGTARSASTRYKPPCAPPVRYRSLRPSALTTYCATPITNGAARRVAS
jgi:HrpA-like RNA helicase